MKRMRRFTTTGFLSVLALTIAGRGTHAFRATLTLPTVTFAHRARSPSDDPKGLYSSIGGGGDDRPPSGGENRKSWDDFLNREGEESENLLRAREYMSENSLPISYDQTQANDAVNNSNEKIKEENSTYAQDPNSSALVTSNNPKEFTGGLTQEILARNPYMAVVSKLSPSELISKFTASAHPRVQNAVRSTILGLIGGLPKMAFDTTTITTGQKLASLMFQLQMTGYMFKNAEYRLSVQQSLGVDNFLEDKLLLAGSSNGETKRIDPLAGKVKGKLRIKYGGAAQSNGVERDEKKEDILTGGLEMEVDAAAYMSELRSEVSKLRDELMTSRKEQDEALRKDLLMYIRTLPQQELQSLTNTMSQDVLVAMKGLVNAVMAGIGEGQISPDTVTEQSGEAMAQLCMWQLVIGYNLRTLEVREEMRKSLTGGVDNKSGEGGVDPKPGALE